MQPDVDRMVGFIRAQLDAEERVAKAAVIPAHDGPGAYKPHPELAAWRYVPDGEVEYVSTPEMVAHEHHEPYRVTCDSEGLLPAVDERVGPHIARQDPASTSARVGADRAILDLCVEANDGAELGVGVSPEQWLAQTVLRHLASGYDDRDGFDESWRPA